MFTGGANVIAVLILLAEFGMFRQALLRDQVRLYMAQSGLISVLAVIVGADRHLPELYVLAALSAALKVVAIPLLLRRLLRDTDPAGGLAGGADIAGSGGLGLASTVLVAIVVAAFGFFAYMTYDLTNMATLKVWPGWLAALDIAWGSVVTALAATAGYWAASRIS